MATHRIASVQRSRNTGCYVVNPMGTFRGHGGHIGLPPYREIEVDAAPSTLGSVIEMALSISGPTGYHIRDVQEFRTQTEDEDSRRVYKKYFSSIRSSADMAKQFQRLEVESPSNDSVLIFQPFDYSAEIDADLGSSLRMEVAPPRDPTEVGQLAIEALRRCD